MRVLVYGVAGHLCGGIETFALEMASRMRRCRFDYIISGEACIHRARIGKADGRVHHVTPLRESPVRHLVEIDGLLRREKNEAQVFYCHLYSMASALPIVLARLRGYRVILHAHNSGHEQSGMLRRLLHGICKRFMPLGYCLRLTNSMASARFMFGKEAQMIHNAIDPERFRFNPLMRAHMRKAYGCEDALVFGFAGRLCEVKRPLLLVDIFKEIADRRENVCLIVLGEGEMRAQMQEAIAAYGLEAKVRMLGHQEDVSAFLQAMDLMILPSRNERLGIALIEAQAAGLACIAQENAVPREAKVTELLTFVPEGAAAKVWAGQCLQRVDCAIADREAGYHEVVKTGFNLEKEASRLEGIILAAAQDRMMAVK